MLYKIWNKETCYEIYFRPLEDGYNVEVITFLNGEPFINPRNFRKPYGPNDNMEVWDIQDARDNWMTWTIHGGYEVSEVEDYLRNSVPRRLNERKRSEKQLVKKETVIPKHIEEFLIDYMKEGK